MCVQLLLTPWTVAHQAPLFSTISRCLLKFMSAESVILLISNHLLYHPSFYCLQSFPELGSFQWIGFSHQVAKVLQLPQQSFQWLQGWLPFGLTGLISLQSMVFSRVFSSTKIQKDQKTTQPFLWFNSRNQTWLLEKNTALPTQMSVVKVISLLFNTLPGFAITFLPRACIF